LSRYEQRVLPPTFTFRFRPQLRCIFSTFVNKVWLAALGVCFGIMAPEFSIVTAPEGLVLRERIFAAMYVDFRLRGVHYNLPYSFEQNAIYRNKIVLFLNIIHCPVFVQNTQRFGYRMLMGADLFSETLCFIVI
jgi:hypothetical protein